MTHFNRFTAPAQWIRTHVLAGVLLALAVPSILMAGPVGYVINFSGQFGKLDLSTGVFTPVGAGTPNTPDGIAGKPGGPFYTVDGVTGHLISITADGTLTDVGDTGTGPNEGPLGVSLVGALTTGSMYALDFSNRLSRIDPQSGVLTILGTVPGLPAQESQYIGNMTTSLNGNETELFYTLEISEGPNQTGPTLFRINPETLEALSLPLTNLTSRIIGSGFVGGVYYAFTEFGDILTIDTNTGEATVAGHYDSGSTADAPGPPLTGIFGVVADVPEPASGVLGGAGLLGISMLGKRLNPRK